MTDLRLTPLAASLPESVPFVGPETLERQNGQTFRTRLGANESVFGPSPKSIAAMAAEAAAAWQYPDPTSFDLKQSLASHISCDPAHIVMGAGIDGLLNSLVRLTVTQGTPVVTSDGAYPTFNYHVTGYGGALHKLSYADDHEDLDGLLHKAREVGARLIYVSNPDNPMGTWHDADQMQRMIDRIPDGCLLVLDEAYLECDADFRAPDLVPDDPRILRFRTFSKAYGLAGIRMGYAIGARPLIAAFNRIRNHFGVSRLSQAAAMAALADQTYLAEVQDKIAQSRSEVARIGAQNGLTALPSATNFVTLDCGLAERAKAVMAALIEQGVFIRMPGARPLDRCIRITCGRPEDMVIFGNALPHAIATADGR